MVRLSSDQISLLIPELQDAAKVFIILFHDISVQRKKLLPGLKDSQDERFAFGDCDTMFKVRGQRPVCRDNCPLVG